MSSTVTTSSPMPLALREPDAFAGPILQVLAGVHRGVRVPIEANGCTIGTSRDSDLILADEAVAADHVRLRFYGKTVAIDAVGGDVAIKGGALVKRGQGCKTSLPVEIGLGTASIRIGQASLPQHLTRRLLMVLGLLTLVVIPIVAVQANILTVSEIPPAAPVTLATADLKPSTVAERPSINTPAPVDADADAEISTQLRQKMDTAGLTMLTVTQDGSHFQVSGQLPPASRAEWDKIQRWFDGSQGQRYVLTSMVAAATVAKAPQFNFQAVWFGKNPYVIDAKGERRYPGSALKDGWAIKSIKKGNIILVRSGEEFTLTL